jgi:thiamine biosynthesis lipoprotein
VIAGTSFPAIGTTAVVAVTEAGRLQEARELLATELDRLDRACSRFRRDSELSRANARAGVRVRVTPLFARYVRVALDAAASTGGLVSPALGEPLRAAGYDRTFALVRARDGWAFRDIAATPDAWREIELDEGRCELRVPRGVALDLGASAKALAADCAAGRIADSTGAGVLVSLGGDLAVAGEVPPGGWPVRIADDHAAALDQSGPTISVSGGGLATSSTTVRAWRVGPGLAQHIIDPRTARPAASPWRLVSVAARSCLEANVSATAAVVLGRDATSWLTRRGVHARLVGAAGDLVRVGAWPKEVVEV